MQHGCNFDYGCTRKGEFSVDIVIDVQTHFIGGDGKRHPRTEENMGRTRKHEEHHAEAWELFKNKWAGEFSKYPLQATGSKRCSELETGIKKALADAKAEEAKLRAAEKAHVRFKGWARYGIKDNAKVQTGTY